MDSKELLKEVETAINKILVGGQSYKIGSRQLTRADLSLLRQLRQELQEEQNDGPNHLMDRTTVAIFEGR